MIYMLDTNICIYAIKNKPIEIINRLESFKDSKKDSLCISNITYSELIFGAEKSKYTKQNLISILNLLSNIPIIEFDNNSAEEFGRIRAQLEKEGKPIGILDAMIAANAKTKGYTLVTNNEKEFNRIKDLKVVNWMN